MVGFVGAADERADQKLGIRSFGPEVAPAARTRMRRTRTSTVMRTQRKISTESDHETATSSGSVIAEQVVQLALGEAPKYLRRSRGYGWGERERGREREKEKEKETERDRETERERQRERETEKGIKLQFNQYGSRILSQLSIWGTKARILGEFAFRCPTPLKPIFKKHGGS